MKAWHANQNRLAVLLALVALALALLLWRGWNTTPHSRVAMPSAEAASSSQRRGSGNVGSVSNRVNSASAERSPADATGHAPVEDQGKGATLTLQFVDPAGLPAGGVQFMLQEGGRNLAYETADSAGRFKLRTTIGASVSVQACGAPKKVDMGRGNYRLEPDFSSPWASRVYRFHVVTAFQNGHLRVWPAKDLLVQALYDDGIPYVGTVSVSIGSIVRYAYQDSADGARVFGVPVRAGVEVGLPAARVGYDSMRYVLTLSEISGSAPIVIIIRRSTDPTGGICVEFSGYADQSVTVMLYSAATGEYMTTGREHRPIAPWASAPLRPGAYSVVVVGSAASRIDDVIVAGGEVVTVRAVASPCATVRARILSGRTRTPIARAVLELAHGSFPDFGCLVPLAGIRAVSDATGIASLPSLAPGKLSFALEALGHNPVRIERVLSPGGEIDLGDIYLEEARGVCVVRITGMQRDFRYALVVRQVGASGTLPWRAVSQEVERIEGLVLGRRYSIGIVLAAGGEFIYEDVILSVSDNPVEVSIDASKAVNPVPEADD